MTIIQLIQTNKAEDSAKGCWSKYIQSRQKLQFKNTHQKVKASNKQHCLSIFNIENNKQHRCTQRNIKSKRKETRRGDKKGILETTNFRKHISHFWDIYHIYKYKSFLGCFKTAESHAVSKCSKISCILWVIENTVLRQRAYVKKR